MNRTKWKWLLAMSLALNVGTVASVLVNKTGVLAQLTGAQPRDLNLPDYLQLNNEQRMRWDQLAACRT